jgi:nucleotide-binding universal stress UspA family protein
VVGEDLFEEAEGAARLAVELGKVFEAEVRLVLAYPRFPQLSTQRVGAGTDAWTAEEGLRRAQEALEELSGELERETGLRPQTQAVVGDSAAVILEDADENGEPVLISVGNRALAKILRSRLGSVSSDVLRAANGPVLVFKRPAG